MPRARRAFITTALTIILGALVLINAALIWLVIIEDGEWDPLGEYPLQEVLSVTTETVTVEGTKCNATDRPVRIKGSVAWQRVDPLGFVLAGGTGTNIRPPGCETETFENDIPASVTRADRPGSLWRIVGVEIPVEPNGKEGRQVTFETEVFHLER